MIFLSVTHKQNHLSSSSWPTAETNKQINQTEQIFHDVGNIYLQQHHVFSCETLDSEESSLNSPVIYVRSLRMNRQPQRLRKSKLIETGKATDGEIQRSLQLRSLEHEFYFSSPVRRRRYELGGETEVRYEVTLNTDESTGWTGGRERESERENPENLCFYATLMPVYRLSYG